MTFEEFFAKKRIDLPALSQGEPALFSEFKIHFDQMGEKSFDHTKKYWFNKIRRQFPLAPQVKTEKVHIANPLAEQTITESLIEAVAPATSPKLGFVPKFKMGATPKPVVSEEKKEEPEAPSTESKPDETVGTKPAYVPKFKMKTKVEATEDKPETDTTPATSENEEAKPKYVPKFKMKPKVEATEDKPETDTTPATSENEEAKPKYVPKFKMKPKVEPLEDKPETDSTPTPPENKEAKPAYKPRFNMKNMPPKKADGDS